MQGDSHIEKCVTDASKRMFLTFKTLNCQLSSAIYTKLVKKIDMRNRLLSELFTWSVCCRIQVQELLKFEQYTVIILEHVKFLGHLAPFNQ